MCICWSWNKTVSIVCIPSISTRSTIMTWASSISNTFSTKYLATHLLSKIYRSMVCQKTNTLYNFRTILSNNSTLNNSKTYQKIIDFGLESIKDAGTISNRTNLWITYYLRNHCPTFWTIILVKWIVSTSTYQMANWTALNSRPSILTSMKTWT